MYLFTIALCFWFIVEGLGLGVGGLRFGVWGLGSGVEGLGRGISDGGFEVSGVQSRSD